MLKMHEWVAEAQSVSGLSGSELSRRLYEKIGRDSADRSIVSKMSKEPGSAGTKARRTTLDEALALSEITGHPLPEGLLRQFRTSFDDNDPPAERTVEPESDDNEPSAQRFLEAYQSRLRLVSDLLEMLPTLTNQDVDSIATVLEDAREARSVVSKPSRARGRHESANHRRE